MWEIKVKFATPHSDVAEHLADVIGSIAPYMVDNVEVTISSED